MENILIALDFSDASEKVFRYGARLANQTGADVTVVHVMHERSIERGLKRFSIKDGDLAEELQESALSHMKNKLEQFDHSIVKDNLNVVKKLLIGKPEITILKEAEEINTDILVIGSRGHGAIKSVLLGSTTDRLVRLSQHPIAVVPINDY